MVDLSHPPAVAIAADLLARIASHAAASPSAPAVTQGDARLAYGALWDDAGRIALRLRERGLGAEDIVGIHVARTPSLVALLLGVWRAGAAWLPLDPAFPEERLAFMVRDSGCRLVCADSLVSWLPPQVECRDLLAMPTDAPREAVTAGANGACSPLDVAPPADRLAYLMYTSGSTGRPKGVEVTHGALANFLGAMAEVPGIAADDVLLAVTTLSFDIALLDLFVPLFVGARVELAPVEEQLAPERLLARLTACGATIMQATPVTWRMLLGAGWGGRLRAVLCGGEAFPPDLRAPLAARADAVWNLYGPTETTVWSTAARIEALPEGRRIPIGQPIANTRVYVMDPEGRPLPDGESGELWIAGTGVARGYRDRPALQARQFVADPVVSGARAYRTGDLGRVADDGQLEHLGRIDEQMKLHGYRIEPGEVEAALAAVPGVHQAVVALAGPEDDPRLVGYVRYTTDAASRPTASAMRRQLRRTLPDYMVPAMLVEIEQVPLTPNGKVDRRALPDPFAASARPASSPEDDAPRTPVERVLAGAWQAMLVRDRVGRHDNFFELGGHSLLALRVVEALAREHGLTIDVRSLFYRTLAQVAEEAR